MKQVKTVTEFEESIKEGTVLVDFFANWCGPCKMVQIELEKIENLPIVKVDVDELNELANKYGIMSIPTLLLFHNDELIARSSGYMPKEVIEDWIETSK